MAGDINRIVLDASIAIAWCFEDEKTTLTEAVLDLLAGGAEAVVPAIWPLEVANALLSAERRKRITVAQTAAFLGRLSGFPILVVPASPESVFDQILTRARTERLTTYDASYLDLTLREAVPLATLDDDLKRAAIGLGLTVIAA